CSDPLVLTGSHNWTASANSNNDENTIIIHNDTIANLYYQSFAEDFLVISGSPLDTIHIVCAVGMPSINKNEININVYPNPFTDRSFISYNLPEAEKVSVSVCDIMGQKVATLVDDEMQSAGYHQLYFKGAAAGIYILNIQAGKNSITKKLVQVN
ncbi:MAG TPA: T9SS type A sorting domain-containing protein, partial [Bacteroidia bacterium]|nr:T9SS type A sorting domain-containing protein [Bacteroidia bacterium]